jgi:hypothetical protein
MIARRLLLMCVCASSMAVAQVPATPEPDIQAIPALLDGSRTRLAEELAACAGVGDAGSAIMADTGEERSELSARNAELTFGLAVWIHFSQELGASDPEAFRQAQENAEASAWLGPFRRRKAEEILTATDNARSAGSDIERPLTDAQHYCSDLIEAVVKRALAETRGEPHGT